MLRRFLDTFGFEYEFAQRDRVLQVGQVRRDAAAGGRALRRDHGGDAGDACARSGSRPIPASCRSRRAVGPGALRADEGGRRRGRHDHLRRRGRPRDDAAGHRRQREAAVEAGLRRALGGARTSISRCTARTMRPTRRSTTGSARSSAAGRRSISSTSCSSTRRASKISKSKGNGLTHRRMADLRQPGEPEPIHVRQAEDGEAAAFRRDPEGDGRVSPRTCGPGRRRTTPARLENPVWHIHRRAAAGVGHGGAAISMLLNLASACERRGQGGALGLHPQVRAGREPGEPSGPRRGGGLCGALLRRHRQAGQDLPRARRARGARRSRDLRDRLRGLGRAGGRRGAADGGLRGRATSTASSRCATGSGRSTRCCSAPTQGPRFGGFVALYGVPETAALIDAALAGEARRPETGAAGAARRPLPPD